MFSFFKISQSLLFSLSLLCVSCSMLSPQVVEYEDLLTGSKRFITEYNWVDVSDPDIRLSVDAEQIVRINDEPTYRLRVRVVSHGYRKNKIRAGTSLKIKAADEIFPFVTQEAGEELEGSGYVDIYINTAFYDVSESQLLKIAESNPVVVWVDAGPFPITGIFSEEHRVVFNRFITELVKNKGINTGEKVSSEHKDKNKQS